MPELPEVETIRRDLARCVLNKVIRSADVLQSKAVGGDSAAFAHSVRGGKFTGIDRVGKLLIFSLGLDKFLLIHLKMTGQLVYRAGGFIVAGGHSETDSPGMHISDREIAPGKPDPIPDLAEIAPGKYTRVILTFADGSKLFFNDLRRFGFMRAVDRAGRDKAVSAFGIEPMTKSFSLEGFVEIFRGRKTLVKAALLNQSLIAGIGNIYSDEICFSAGVRPSRRAASLSSSDVRALFLAVNRILRRAVKERGTTFSTYVDGAGNKGNFIRHLRVYGRGGFPCKRCGRPLAKKRIAGRGTVFCRFCQH